MFFTYCSTLLLTYHHTYKYDFLWFRILSCLPPNWESLNMLRYRVKTKDFWDGRIIQDYLGGPNIITGFLIRERQKSQSPRRRCDDQAKKEIWRYCTLKMRPQVKECSGLYKLENEGNILPWGLQKVHNPETHCIPLTSTTIINLCCCKQLI